uniref:Uncharacterized protein n=1 Tax=Cryptomonas curvata TaxID=233186 RepID=A0A7S0LVC9_9CRYP|mmetsp:Transcript_12375/g.26569  ORF Transcript_12375/g.26569 Transcript_12375/m.26569 type:complete len:100 (+) Transcript_12375:167-466(+)
MIGRNFVLLVRGDFIASIPFIVIAVVGLLAQESGLSAFPVSLAIANRSDWLLDITILVGISFIALSGAIAACTYSNGGELPTAFRPLQKGLRGALRSGG